MRTPFRAVDASLPLRRGHGAVSDRYGLFFYALPSHFGTAAERGPP
jgi:hypothetical protein